MGSWFSNIQIKYDKEIDTLNAEHIASLLARKRGMEKTDQAHADIEIAVYIPENSGWATVASDLMDGDGAALLACAGELSAILKTETIAISCMDSDYLFLNLIDAEKGTDAWAACGRYPDGKAPRRSNFAPWKPYAADWKAFRKAMKGKYVFAEQCLHEIEPLLSLPAEQSMGEKTDGPHAAHFYFRYLQQEMPDQPPSFFCRLKPLYYHSGGQPNIVSFINQGEASRGVGVCLTGPCIHENQVDVTSLLLQFHDQKGEWAQIPIDFQMTEFSDGVSRVYGECRDIRIPPAVPGKLPWKKLMDMEFQRGITVRFTLVPREGQGEEKLREIHVILIPLRNFPGQCGVVMKHRENRDD